MTKCLIGFGCSQYYLFIFGEALFKLLKFFVFSIINDNNKTNFFGFVPILSKHFLIRSLYKYISFIIGGLLFNYFNIKNMKKEKNSIITKRINERLTLKGIIHNIKDNGKGKHIIQVLLACFIYSFYNESTGILYFILFNNIHFWIFKFIFLIIFMNVYFKIDIYKHQKCSIIFNITSNIIILLIFSFFPKIENDKNYPDFVDKNSYQIIDTIIGFDFSFIFVIFCFIFLFFIKSYAKVKTKVFLDFYFISPYKIVLDIGLIGLVLTIIGLFISSFSECQNNIIKKYICINEKNNTNYYFDSIFIYLHDLKNNSLIIEIILTFFYLIICFFEFTCEIMTIYYLNSMYTLIKDNLYYFCMRIILFIRLSFGTKQFIILEMAEICALLGYSVYLEIIELRFFGLDKDIRKNIIRRGDIEAINIINTPDDYYDDENLKNGNDNNNIKENIEFGTN